MNISIENKIERNVKSVRIIDADNIVTVSNVKINAIEVDSSGEGSDFPSEFAAGG